MAYITVTDIYNVAGQSNVVLWSNLDGSTTSVNSTRVSAAISWAESRVHTRLEGAFVVPLAAARGTLAADAADVIDLIAKMAASWLYSNRRVQEADSVSDVPGGWRREAEQLMDSWVSGAEQVNLQRRANRRNDAPLVF